MSSSSAIGLQLNHSPQVNAVPQDNWRSIWGRSWFVISASAISLGVAMTGLIFLALSVSNIFFAVPLLAAGIAGECLVLYKRNAHLTREKAITDIQNSTAPIIQQAIDLTETSYVYGPAAHDILDWDKNFIICFGEYDQIRGVELSTNPKIAKERLAAHGRDKRFNFLSNYFPVTLKVPDEDGVCREYRSVEHYYQAMKFPIGSAAYREVVNAPTPNQAREIGRKHMPPSDRLALLDNDEVMIKVLKRALWAKFVNLDGTLTDCGIALLGTGTQDLVEGNCRTQGKSDKRWGAEITAMRTDNCEWVRLEGKNLLGKLLMDLRSNLNRTPQILSQFRW